MSSSYSLGPHFDAFIQEQLASSRYASASEIVRAGLRLLEEHEESRHANVMKQAEKLEWLKAEVQKAIDSPKIDGDTAMNGLHGRVAKRNAEVAIHEAA